MRKFFQLYSTRIDRLSLTIVLFSFILLFSFFRIQVIDNVEIKNIVQNKAFKTSNIYGKRGRILDRNYNQLSATINKYDFWVNTNDLFDKEKIISLFSSTFNKPDSIYRKKLSKKSNYIKLEKNILFSNCEKILLEINEVKGLRSDKKSKRFYPYNNLACQTLGYINLDGQAIGGIEENLNTLLSGDTTSIQLRKGAKGKYYKQDNINHDSINGNDVVLTIDIEIQNILQNELLKAVNETSAKSANGIIMDPFTGDILAIASIPDFNPNNYFDYNIANFKNRTVTDSYEPGSTFKIIPLIASFDNYNLNKKYYCENGMYRLTSGKKLHDHEPHDSLSIKEIFIHSSNIGISKIVDKIDYKNIYKICRNLGFGSKTGLPFKNESKGKLREINTWSKTSKTYISIGQEIGITNIQLAQAYSAIANGGYLIKPHIIKSIKENHNYTYNRKINPLRQVVSKKTSIEILKILKEVVDKGTAKNLNLRGYDIGGKTGTAQKYIDDEYSKNNFIASFASIFPTNSPEYVIIISIDSPEYGKHWANESAVPVSRNIINRIMIKNGHLINNSILLNNKKIIDKERTIKTNTYIKNSNKIDIIPNLKGKTLRDALLLANSKGIELDPIGISGKIIWQSIKPGSKINDKTICKVKLSS
tara:strand:+ start:2293 stop:4233 length:1941 start_codon:yes stop_codon:yes gene_type:complete